MTQTELLSLAKGQRVYSGDFKAYARVVEVRRSGFVLAFDKDLMRPVEEAKAHPDLRGNEVFYPWESRPDAFDLVS